MLDIRESLGLDILMEFSLKQFYCTFQRRKEVLNEFKIALKTEGIFI